MIIKNLKNKGYKSQLGLTMIETLACLALVILIIGGAITLISRAFSSYDVGKEISNIKQIMTNARGSLKTKGQYPFTNADSMMESLIKFDGIPGDMIVSKNTAENAWGGKIFISPTKRAGATTNGAFSLTYQKVPEDACVTLATKMSESKLVNEIEISGTKNTGSVTAEKATQQCKEEENTLVFVSSS